MKECCLLKILLIYRQFVNIFQRDFDYVTQRSKSVTWRPILRIRPVLLLLFGDNKIKMAGKKQKENPVGCTGEGEIRKVYVREGSTEGKTGTVLQLSLEVR